MGWALMLLAGCAAPLGQQPAASNVIASASPRRSGGGNPGAATASGDARRSVTRGSDDTARLLDAGSDNTTRLRDAIQIALDSAQPASDPSDPFAADAAVYAPILPLQRSSVGEAVQGAAPASGDPAGASPAPAEALAGASPAPPAAALDTPRLPPESVQRVVRKSAGRFRECLQRGLESDPQRQGRVVVRFTIGADGRVSRAEEELATFPDRDARRCLLQRFFELQFPPPPEQSLTIRYPLRISNGAARPPDALRDARRTAEPPPPGFAEALRTGRRVSPPAPPTTASPPPREAAPKPCSDSDPLCAEL